MKFIIDSGMFNWIVISKSALLDVVWPEKLEKRIYMYSLLRPFADKDFKLGKESVNEYWIYFRDIYQKLDYEKKI